MKGGVFTTHGFAAGAGMSSTQKASRGKVPANARATASANGRGSGYELTGTPSKPRQRTTASEGRRASFLDRRLIAGVDHVRAAAPIARRKYLRSCHAFVMRIHLAAYRSEIGPPGNRRPSHRTSRGPRGDALQPNVSLPDACAARGRVGAGGGIRTHTVPILSRLPLPIGLHQRSRTASYTRPIAADEANATAALRR